jgi:hypothetical protein
MIRELWIGKDVERRGHGEVLHQHLPGGTDCGENHENLVTADVRAEI